MLDYEWGNPPTFVLSGEDQTPESDPTRPTSIFDPSHHSFTDHHHHISLLSPPPSFSSGSLSNHHIVGYGGHTQNQFNQFHHSFYDPRVSYAGDQTYTPTHHHAASTVAAASALFSLDQTVGGTPAGPYFVVPKNEDLSRPALDFTSSRIGLNLGGRTYFSAADDDFVSRLYRRSRPGEPGGGNSLMSSPRCQAEGCNADLSHAKHYHRRHKVCEFHSKASTVIAAGLTQRFCQQCSRFHLLSEFDNGKRSCRKRLADHNRRRRKSHQSSAAVATTSYDSPKPPPEITSTPRSPNESRVQSSSTVPLSPPTISLNCFQQRQYQATASSSSASSSSNSIFFSSG